MASASCSNASSHVSPASPVVSDWTGMVPSSGSRRMMSRTTSAAWPRTGVIRALRAQQAAARIVRAAFEILDRQAGGQPHSDALPDRGGSRPQQVRQLAVVGHRRAVAALEQRGAHPVPGADTPQPCGHVPAGCRNQNDQDQGAGQQQCGRPSRGRCRVSSTHTVTKHREQEDLGAQPDQQPDDAGGKRPLRSQEQVEHTRRSGRATETAAPRRTGTRRRAAGHGVPSPQNWGEREELVICREGGRVSRWARGRPIRVRDVRMAVPCPPVLDQVPISRTR